MCSLSCYSTLRHYYQSDGFVKCILMFLVLFVYGLPKLGWTRWEYLRLFAILIWHNFTRLSVMHTYSITLCWSGETYAICYCMLCLLNFASMSFRIIKKNCWDLSVPILQTVFCFDPFCCLTRSTSRLVDKTMVFFVRIFSKRRLLVDRSWVCYTLSVSLPAG